ncbi:hypothetical protein EHZ25_26565 [Paraburkholderia tropica]|nr:hypothetical protein EHZ25_26565 [Paraburkholderia tropica]
MPKSLSDKGHTDRQGGSSGLPLLTREGRRSNAKNALLAAIFGGERRVAKEKRKGAESALKYYFYYIAAGTDVVDYID